MKRPPSELTLIPTYSEDGSILTLVIIGSTNRRIDSIDLADLIQAFLDQLDDPGDPN